MENVEVILLKNDDILCDTALNCRACVSDFVIEAILVVMPVIEKLVAARRTRDNKFFDIVCNWRLDCTILVNETILLVIALKLKLPCTDFARLENLLTTRLIDKLAIDDLTALSIFVIAPVTENISDAVISYILSAVALTMLERLKDENTFTVSNWFLIADNERDMGCNGILISDSSFVDNPPIENALEIFRMNEDSLVVIENKFRDCVNDLTNVCALLDNPLNENPVVTDRIAEINFTVIELICRLAVDVLKLFNIFVIAPVTENISDAVAEYILSAVALTMLERLKDENTFTVSNWFLIADNERDIGCVNNLIIDVSFVDIAFNCKPCMTFLKNKETLADIICRLNEAVAILRKLEILETIEDRERGCDSDLMSVCVFVTNPLNDRLETEERSAEINFAVMP